MIPQETIDHWFTYHEHAGECEQKRQRVREAEIACGKALLGVFLKLEAEGTERIDFQKLFDQTNAATKLFSETINETVPDSADKAAAIRCVRLARLAANEGILEALEGRRVSARCFVDLASDELVKARWQAIAALDPPLE